MLSHHWSPSTGLAGATSLITLVIEDNVPAAVTARLCPTITPPRVAVVAVLVGPAGPVAPVVPLIPIVPLIPLAPVSSKYQLEVVPEPNNTS